MANGSGATGLLPWFDMASSPPMPQQPPSRAHLAQSFFGSAPLLTGLVPQAIFPDSIPRPSSRAHLAQSFFGSAPLTKPSVERDYKVSGSIPSLRIHSESAITCLNCGTVFRPTMSIHFSGPNEVRVQGEGYFPCCGGPQPPSEPTVVRGQEEEVPESGPYLIVEPDENA